MTIQEFRSQAGRGWQSNDDLPFLRYLDLARTCPDFPVDMRRDMTISPGYGAAGRWPSASGRRAGFRLKLWRPWRR